MDQKETSLVPREASESVSWHGQLIRSWKRRGLELARYEREEYLEDAREMTRKMERLIFGKPHGRFGLGLDPLLGLIPVVGDILSSVATAYLIFLGYKVGVSWPRIFRCVFIGLVDFLLGSWLGHLGDVIDIWRANSHVLDIIEKQHEVLCQLEDRSSLGASPADWGLPEHQSQRMLPPPEPAEWKERLRRWLFEPGDKPARPRKP